MLDLRYPVYAMQQSITISRKHFIALQVSYGISHGSKVFSSSVLVNKDRTMTMIDDQHQVSTHDTAPCVMDEGGGRVAMSRLQWIQHETAV